MRILFGITFACLLLGILLSCDDSSDLFDFPDQNPMIWDFVEESMRVVYDEYCADGNESYQRSLTRDWTNMQRIYPTATQDFPVPADLQCR